MKTLVSLLFSLLLTLERPSLANAQSCTGVVLQENGSQQPVNGSEVNSASLQCFVGNIPDDVSYLWKFNEALVPSQTNFRWDISPLTSQVGGIYQCGYNSDSCGTRYSNTLAIIIPPHVTTTNNVQETVQENEDFELTCEADGYPQPSLAWYFSGSKVSDAYNHVISSASEYDTGRYVCVANNSAGYATVSVDVTVWFAPKLTKALTNTSAIAGQDVSLVCEARAFPTPSIKWEKDGVEVGSSSILTLTSVSLDDAGRYTCTVTNSKGVVSSSLYLTIQAIVMSTSSAAVTPTSSNTGSGSSESGLSQGEVAGIVIIVVLAVILIITTIALIWVIWYCYKVFKTPQHIKRTGEKTEDKEELIDSESNEDKDNTEVVETLIEDSDGDSEYEEMLGEDNKMILVKKKKTKGERRINNMVEGLNQSVVLTPSELEQAAQQGDVMILEDVKDHRMRAEYESVPINATAQDYWPTATKSKNRYRNVLPNPETIVVLSDTGEPASTYINANYIRGYDGTKKTYIAAQAPIYDTIPDFWRMIWESDIDTIVMITGIIERGRNKCALYWPPSEGNNTVIYGNFVVTNNHQETKADYVVTFLTVSLKNQEPGGQKREIHHYWLTSWPDFGVPNQTYPILELREAIEAVRTNSGSTNKPLLVHCSAGLGRTGAYIAIDQGIRQLNAEGVVDPLRWLCEMRKCRGGMIQTIEQYVFVYRVLAAYAAQHSK